MRNRSIAVRYFLLSLASILLLVASVGWQLNPAAVAQPIRIEELWQQVYQDLPDLPRENQYVNQETGDPSPNNTLVSRMIRYHVYSKGRPVTYRLDWKLTLADYLGVNERMEPNTYPSGTSLTTNPMDGDIAAVRSLNRSQRDALVNALVRLFTPSSTPEASPPVSQPPAPPTPSPSSPPANSRFPRQPQPGDAQLLLP
ncbi:MAG: hypothetical protein MUF72_19125 [Elainella sp. Prado103]|jgi:hypothetical protein|nr:hypothetical protein [Elainella sp. Prado103]